MQNQRLNDYQRSPEVQEEGTKYGNDVCVRKQRGGSKSPG